MLHFSISRAILALNHAMLIYYLVRLREVTVDPVALCNNGFWRLGHFAQRLKTNCLVQLHFSVLNPCAITILSIGLCHSQMAYHLLLRDRQDEAEPFSHTLERDNAGVNRAHAHNQGGVPCP